VIFTARRKSALEELATLRQVRSFMESKVAPIINKYWFEDSFPFELLLAFKDLTLGGPLNEQFPLQCLY